MTDIPEVLLSVHTADCLPILIVDERRRAVAAVHAGWRGTAQGIAVKVAQAMAERFGSRPGDLHVAIGPGIGVCCYEVGAEVASQLTGLFPERTDLLTRTHIDLAEANRRQLLQAEVRDERIYTADCCTSCEAEQFHSWRRDRRQAGRMLSVIGIRS
jgi:YfiH family protein